MTRSSILGIALVLMVGAAASAGAAPAKFISEVATPVGITLQPLGAGQGLGLVQISGGFLAAHKTAYGDARGMTLYTYEKDQPGKSTCYDACATTNPPALVSGNPKTSGSWSTIKRKDGSRQWAHKGRALYTFVQDTLPGSIGGVSPGTRAADAKDKAAISSDFKVAYYEPDAGIQLPRGIRVEAIADANGHGLVDTEGRTIYAFDGNASQDNAECGNPCPFVPLASAQLSVPTGDFTIIVRDDGITQWSYKGAPLYTYDRDPGAGYARGAAIGKRWRVALVSTYPLPPGIKMHLTPGRGLVWADEKGLTLYRRDAIGAHTGGGHSLRRGVVMRPAVGRQIGASGCTANCEDTMRPVLAPANAQASGYWETLARPDGRKQWAYKGYALYSCTCDRKPGDMNANDQYDIFMSTDPEQIVDIGTPTAGAAGLFWLISEPY